MVAHTARKSLTAKVEAALRAEIAENRIAPGNRLPTEPALVARFGVSRTVVREAIAGLRAEGLVESRQGAGVFVLRTTPPAIAIPAPALGRISEVIEEVELRAAVEIEAAGLAATRATPGQIAEIESAFEVFAGLVRQAEPTAEADFAFHMAVARATNNARFVDFLAQLGRRTIPRASLHAALGGSGLLPDRDTELCEEHRAVSDAIATGDADAARDRMRAHLLGSLARYRMLARRAAQVGNGSG